MPAERLFIKVIIPKQGRERKVPPGGGANKIFKDVTPLFRQSLVSRLTDLENIVRVAPTHSRIVPARVTLEKDAIAKSHRPENLFTSDTCPIIGAGKPGELYIKASRYGLEALKVKIARNTSKQTIKDISTIQDIVPISPQDRLGGLAPEELLDEAPLVSNRKLVKVKLFDYGHPDEEQRKAAAFESFLNERNISFRKAPQFAGQDIYIVNCRSANEVSLLANAVMVRSVGKLASFKSLRNFSFNSQPLPATLQRLGPNPKEFPIVAVVDSGISGKVLALNEWIYKREIFVASANANPSHGTFVAGLLVWGNQLNSGIPEIGPHPCRLLDIQVLPNYDEQAGPVVMIFEDELLQTLDDCLSQYANEVKVWNISMGTGEICRLDQFSDFAVQLDNLQETYGVSFVIAAGNYVDPPLLAYPRKDEDAARGRIMVPADSVLGITVGSVAQVDHPSTGTLRGEPSPFSRHGPGPNYVIKPDLVQVGGNMALDSSLPLGLMSIGHTGSTVVEDVGTSFSAPLVSRPLAYIYHRVIPTPSNMLARAILTHSARDPRTGKRVEDGDDHYLGFGIPLDIDNALECQPWMTTLVFEETLRNRYYLEWDDFPYPESLTSGNKFRGEIWMTIAYSPKRSSTYGSEYCETHVEASFGVYKDRKSKNGMVKEVFESLVPVEHKRKGVLYESFQVEKLRKWAPVRTYYKLLKDDGEIGKRWRLKVRLLSRHGVDDNVFSSQPFALLLTIADPNRKAPVYDEMAWRLRSRFQSRNLTLRPSIQIRTRS